MQLTRDEDGDWTNEERDLYIVVHENPSRVTITETEIKCESPAEAEALRDRLAAAIDPTTAGKGDPRQPAAGPSPSMSGPGVAKVFGDTVHQAFGIVGALKEAEVEVHDFVRLLQTLLEIKIRSV